jgi:hypothetical protein
MNRIVFALVFAMTVCGNLYGFEHRASIGTFVSDADPGNPVIGISAGYINRTKAGRLLLSGSATDDNRGLRAGYSRNTENIYYGMTAGWSTNDLDKETWVADVSVGWFSRIEWSENHIGEGRLGLRYSHSFDSVTSEGQEVGDGVFVDFELEFPHGLGINCSWGEREITERFVDYKDDFAVLGVFWRYSF